MRRAVAALAFCAVAGCGSGSEAPQPVSTFPDVTTVSAEEVLAAAQAAADQARSVHVVGQISQGGQRTTLDLTLRASGDGAGFIETTGGRIDVARTDRDLYFKADEATLIQVLGPDRAREAGSRFVKVPVGDATFRTFRELLDMKQVFAMLLDPKGAVTRVAGVPVDGVTTVGVEDGDPDAGGVLYVAATGTPFPLLLRPNKREVGDMELRLTDWNADTPIAPPPANQVVDLDELET